MILFILPSLLAFDVLWWIWADARCRKTWTGGTRRKARLIVALFSFLQLTQFIGLISARALELRWPGPAWLIAQIYLWHLIVLPATTIGIVIWSATIVAKDLSTRLTTKKIPSDEIISSENLKIDSLSNRAGKFSRRQILTAAALAIPPLATVATSGYAWRQLGTFRIRRLTIPLASLPSILDGMTIAQVSDVHVGRFTKAGSLTAIADATNLLRADIVALTGDLIDYSLGDLSDGINMVRRLDPRSGIAMVEGNHDLFEDRDAFESRSLAAALPLLLNSSTTVRVRGFDVQLLGTRWGNRFNRSAMYDEHTRNALAGMRTDHDAFPILLAHHPHAFDAAAEKNAPLTLAGHTHGGQLMLTKNIGPGPMLYKYWSGLYRRGDSALVVSNGVGNWFPLRINAPTEIVHITLRCA